MKKKIFCLLLVVLLSFITNNSFSQTSFPNPDFETWVNGEPEYWDSSNKNILGTIFEGVVQDTLTPQSGNSAAMLKTTIKTVGSFPVTLPGILTLGEIIIDFINQTGTITAGVAFTGRPDEFKGYYKSSPAAGDSCFIGIGFTKWDGNQRDTIAGGYFYESSKEQNWTEFIIPLDYNTTDNPDSMNIIIGSSDITNMLAVLGSTFWVDNLSLDYGGVSIFDVKMNKSFSVYPDQSKKNLIISLNFDKSQKTKISLFSIDGKLMHHYTKNIEKSLETINITNHQPGIYIVDVRTSDGHHFTQKVGINL